MFNALKSIFSRAPAVAQGPQLITAAELVVKLPAGDYTFAGMPVTVQQTLRNFLIVGESGAGKTLVIDALAEQFGTKGLQMVVNDPTGDKTQHFFRGEQDHLLSVMDARCAGYSILNDVRTPFDVATLVAGFMPGLDASDTGRYITVAARTVAAAAVSKAISAGAVSNADLADLLLQAPDALAQWLSDTPAAAYFEQDRPAGAICAQLDLAFGVLRYLPDGDLSLREWVAKGGDTRLFVGATGSQLDQGLRACIFATLTDAALELPVTDTPRLAVVFDEGHSAPLEVLQELATEGQKHGIVNVLGVQHVNFDAGLAATIRGNFHSELILRTADSEVASRMLGCAEIAEVSEMASYGADGQDRYGSQVSVKEIRLVLPAEIEALKPCQGYVRICYGQDVVKVEIPIVKRPQIAEAYVSRQG